ncbi:PREDICTED: uncharacterized protein LOC109154879 [Ipomoea nil]|uniref:uncharacterized protein LOC109154879 n=1 Tax=Ipomoea nil TaxID=35883 RepID=UPI000901DB8F|nr:PREDICTED: uncharacterized protein LOC109154879 [Ipomoea nil]
MGDYNDILHQSEKMRRNLHPNWLIAGFNDAVADSGLMDFPFQGNQYTWVRSRGTPAMIEEKLDRVLTTDSLVDLFNGATTCSLTCPYSDHSPLLLTPVRVPNGVRRRHFCFDNLWLREDRCREIIDNSWGRTMGLDVLDRIAICGQDIWRWGELIIKSSILVSRKRRNRIKLLRKDNGAAVDTGNGMRGR